MRFWLAYLRSSSDCFREQFFENAAARIIFSLDYCEHLMPCFIQLRALVASTIRYSIVKLHTVHTGRSRLVFRNLFKLLLTTTRTTRPGLRSSGSTRCDSETWNQVRSRSPNSHSSPDAGNSLLDDPRATAAAGVFDKIK
jgi:hypothetical protein